MATVAPEVPVLARDEAFEQFYRRYVTDVYHYALALLRNPADAEDVTQTTFMNAYRAFRRGDEILKPQNWLIKIAHNVARSRYSRMSRRVKEVPLEDHVEHLAVPEDESPDVDAVLRALGRLPFNQRAALIMRELEGRSYVEIADTLGVSVPAVETLIFRARRSLRVRAAALKSIAAVPLPSSLMQLFEGGGLVAGGVGTGFLAKAAVALIAGAFATGVGGADRSNRAVAASDSHPAATATAVTHATNIVRKANVSRPRVLRTRPATATASSAAGPMQPPAALPASATTAPTVATPTAATRPAKPLSQPLSLPPPTPVQTVVQDTVDTTAATVQQTVNAVTSPLPVGVPPLPVQVPQLPKLPKLP